MSKFSPVLFSVIAVVLSTGCDPLSLNALEGTSGQYCDLGLNGQSSGAEIAPNSSLYETTQVAQQFQTSSQLTISSVTLRLEGSKTPTPGNLTVMIEEDAGGAPNNVPVATASFLASTVTQGFNNYQFSFPTDSELAADSKYWVILSQQANIPNAIFWAGLYTQTPSEVLGLNTVTNQWSSISSGVNRVLLFSFSCI